jgi:hypothetical protein
MTVAAHEQRALVDRLMSACGESYSPEIRRRIRSPLPAPRPGAVGRHAFTIMDV